MTDSRKKPEGRQVEKRLRDELATTERELAELSFDAARQRIEAAEEALRRFATPAGQKVNMSAGVEEAKAAGELKQARAAFAELEKRREELQARIQSLHHALSAADREEAALADAALRLEEVLQARAELAAAQRRVARLDEMLKDEIAADEAAVAADGAAVLADLKAGGDGSAAIPVRTSKTRPLQVAMQDAEREAQAAEVEVSRAEGAHRDAVAAVYAARSDLDELSFRDAEEVFIKAAARCMAARVRARRPGMFVGPYQERAMALMEAHLAADAA